MSSSDRATSAPHVVLGVDYGTPPSEASIAFARISRRIKTRGAVVEFTIEDATEALHRIEHAATVAAADVRLYRVPANPAAYLDSSDDHGLANPEPQRLPRTAPPLSNEEYWSLRGYAVLEALAGDLDALALLGIRLGYDTDQPSP